MINNREELFEQNGSVTFFNKWAVNFKYWEIIYIFSFVIGVISAFLFEFFYLNNSIEASAVFSFGFGLITILVVFWISFLFRPWYPEAMR